MDRSLIMHRVISLKKHQFYLKQVFLTNLLDIKNYRVISLWVSIFYLPLFFFSFKCPILKFSFDL